MHATSLFSTPLMTLGWAAIIPINHMGKTMMKKTMPTDIERSAIRKLTLHIVPLMILLYFLAFLDRNNMAYAAKALEDNLGLTASAFGFASGIFFIGYFLFEIPSNAGTIKFGPRIWFARILISWGIFATLLGFVRTPLELYICRFMLGVCEAGFFPSVVYYFTVFFPEKYRTKILGMFIIVQPLSNAVGSPISGFILNIQHDWFGFAPWQLLFILEGLPPIVIGLLIPFLIKNSPKDVGYLNVEEKAWLMSNAGRSKSGSKITLADFLKGIKNKKYLLYALLNFGMVCGIYGFGTWLPSIISALSGGDIFRVSLLALIPYGLAEHVAKLDVLRRRQRFQHRPLFEQQPLDLFDAREDFETVAEFVLLHQPHRRLQLVQHQLHPQLGGLVLYHEQHFVMMRRVGEWVLAVQQRVQAQVVAIAHAFGKIGDNRAF